MHLQRHQAEAAAACQQCCIDQSSAAPGIRACCNCSQPTSSISWQLAPAAPAYAPAYADLSRAATPAVHAAELWGWPAHFAYCSIHRRESVDALHCLRADIIYMCTCIECRQLQVRARVHSSKHMRCQHMRCPLFTLHVPADCCDWAADACSRSMHPAAAAVLLAVVCAPSGAGPGRPLSWSSLLGIAYTSSTTCFRSRSTFVPGRCVAL